MSSRGTTIRIVTVAVVGLIMLALAGEGAQAQQQSILRGIVVDQYGAPIAGVLVSITLWDEGRRPDAAGSTITTSYDRVTVHSDSTEADGSFAVLLDP